MPTVSSQTTPGSLGGYAITTVTYGGQTPPLKRCWARVTLIDKSIVRIETTDQDWSFHSTALLVTDSSGNKYLFPLTSVLEFFLEEQP